MRKIQKIIFIFIVIALILDFNINNALAYETVDDQFTMANNYIREYTDEEKEYIAMVVYAESRGEIFEGQVAVAAVVINRFESGLFGDSVKKVVFANSQFAVGSKYNDENMEAVEYAIENRGYPANMFYFQASKSRRWRNFIYYIRIGNHSFYLSSD